MESERVDSSGNSLVRGVFPPALVSDLLGIVWGLVHACAYQEKNATL